MPGRLIIKMDPNYVSAMDTNRHGLRWARPAGPQGAAVYTITDGKSVAEKLAEMANNPGEAAELAGWLATCEHAPCSPSHCQLPCSIWAPTPPPPLPDPPPPCPPRPGPAAFEFAEPDYRVPVNWQPNDPLLRVQWHHATVASPLAWNATTGRQEVRVCHIDSGIRTDHPDLQGRVLKGWNMVPEVQVGAGPGRSSYKCYLGHSSAG